MKRATALTITLAMVLSLLMTLSAQARGMGGGPGNGGSGGKGFGRRVMQELGLSADQQQAIQGIIQKYEEEQDKAREALQQSREELFAGRFSAGFDEAKIRQAFKERSAAMEDAFVLRARIHNEIQAVLTPEQSAELEQARAKHRRSEARSQRHKNSRHARLKGWPAADGDERTVE